MADWPYNTAQWQRLRRAHLDQFPLCEDCKAAGHIRIANTVDHRVPISDGGQAFPVHDGLASYCPSCHGAKTARGVEAGAVRTNKPRRGCDANGLPLDARHDWHEKSLRADRLRPRPEINSELVRLGKGPDSNG